MHKLVISYLVILVIIIFQASKSEESGELYTDNLKSESRHGIKFAWIPENNLSDKFKKADQSKIIDKHADRLLNENKGYFMSVYEITQAEWENIIGEKFIDFLDAKGKMLDIKAPIHIGLDKPVYFLDFTDASRFVEILNAKEQKSKLKPRWRYAIPSESEWEYAARAGIKNDYLTGKYLMPSAAAFSYDLTGLDYDKLPAELLRQVNTIGGVDGPCDVGKRSIANAFGLFDVHGNVAEITSTKAKDVELIYPGISDPDIYVRKGGAWISRMSGCKFSLSAWTGTKLNRVETGLRVIAYPIE